MKRQKYLHRISLLMIMIVLIFPMKVLAEEQDQSELNIRITAPDNRKPGETIRVTVKVPDDVKVAMAQFDLSYDSERLTLLDVKAGDCLKGEPTINSSTEGHIYIAWENTTAVQAKGEWLYCDFRAEEEGTAWVSIEQNPSLLFADGSMNPYQVLSTDKMILIQGKKEALSDTVAADQNMENKEHVLNPEEKIAAFEKEEEQQAQEQQQEQKETDQTETSSQEAVEDSSIEQKETMTEVKASSTEIAGLGTGCGILTAIVAGLLIRRHRQERKTDE